MAEKVPRPELINDVNRVYEQLGRDESLTIDRYDDEGEYSASLVIKRFDGSWSEILESIGMYDKVDVNAPGKEYSQSEVEEMIESMAEECRGKLTQRHLNKVLPVSWTYCLDIIPDDNFCDMKERLDLGRYDESPVKYWIQELEGEVGRFEPEEIKEMVEDATDNMFVPKKHVARLVEASEGYEGLTVSSSQSGLNGSKVYVRTEGVDPFEKYREDLPYRDFTEEWFDEVVSSGFSPKTTSAAVMYLMQEIPGRDDEGKITQSGVADELDVTPISVRNVLDELSERFSNVERLREEIR